MTFAAPKRSTLASTRFYVVFTAILVSAIVIGALPSWSARAERNNSSSARAASPETVVLNDDFEGATTFVAANSTVNAWVIGTAAANGGTNGAYISNNAGVSNAYTNTVTSGNHFYAPITVPAGETAVVLSFDWRGIADFDATADFDYLRVSVRTAVPVAGTMPTAAEQIPITYSGQDNFTRAYVNLPASVATGTPQFLVFSWVNDSSVGTLPTAIDNVLVTSQAPAPLSGTKTIPGDYPSIGAAIANLNANGADTSGGSLTFNVAAASTFTETPSPLTTSGSSATNRIVFLKSGAGANPKIIAEGGGNFGAPQTSLTSGVTSTSDAIIAINTADFVTFDGIDVQSSSVSGVSPFSKIEYGYLLRNNNILANVTTINGAQNNIIQNMSITLDRRKTSPTQTIGIMQSAATGVFGAGSVATSAAQSNSGNKYYNLTIQNAYAGIYLLGTAAFPDDLTEVGTTSPTTFNTIGAATANDIGNGTVLSWGIRAGSQSNAKFFNNEIRNITSTGTTTVAGIHMDNAGTVTAVSLGTTEVYRNIIHDLNGVNAAAGVIYGIRANLTGNAGSVSRIYNNFIYGLNSTSTVTASRRIVGIFTQDAGVGTGSTHNVNNNSVRIAPATVGASNTCFEIGGAGATNPVYNVRNNIFANFTGAQAGAAKHYTWVTTSTTAIGPAGSVSNFNDLYVNNTTNGFTGLTNATDRITLADWQAAVVQDANSINTNPLFAGTTDLHIISGSPAIDTATTIAFVTDDIDNQTRPQAVAYDIGADELVPAPGTLQLSSTTYGGSEGGTANATVNRVSGSSGIVGVTYTLTDGTATGGAACTAGVDYINPGPQLLSFGDGVTSQPITVTLCTDVVLDPGETFTITLSSPTGGATLGSPTVATVTIQDIPPPFNGSVNVGTAQPYTSLTNPGGIFEAINLAGATGNITINITSDLAGETGAVALNEIAGTITVLIKPSGAPRAVSGSSAGYMIPFNGTDNVTFDGSLSGGADRSLTVTNTGSGGIIAFTSGAAGAQFNTLKNVNVVGGGPTTTLIGIAFGGNTFGTAGTDNDNNRIENNSVRRTIIGVYSAGASVANQNTGTVVTRNDLTGTGADRVGRTGMVFFNDNGIQITENRVGGLSTAESIDAVGIGVGVGTADGQFSNTAATSGGITNALVSRNQVNGVAHTNTWGAAGIAIAGDVAGANVISNNMISGVIANTTSPDIVAGIFVAGVTGSTTRLYHNSVAMTGDRGATASQNASYAVAISGTNPIVELKNNIFYTTQVATGGGAAAESYSIGMTTATFTNLDSDFNDFYAAGANASFFRSGSLAGAAGTDYATLALWQAAVSDDVNSQEVDPLFINPVSDLHLQGTSPLLGDGTPAVLIPADFDNDPRPATAPPNGPDIGADEVVQATGGVIPAGNFYNVSTASGNTLGGNVTVRGVLTLNGITSTGASTLTIDCNATVSGASDINYVDGNVQKNFCAPGSFSYPVGDPATGSLVPPLNGYMPVDVTVTTLTVNPSSLTVSANNGLAPSTPPLNPATTLSAFWTLTEVGDLTATLAFNYQQGDVNGNEATYRVIAIEGTTPFSFPTTVLDTVNNIATVSGITNFSDWTVGEPFAPTAIPANINGRVVTNTGAPLAGVTMTLLDTILVESRTTVTDPNGFYHFNAILTGRDILVTPSRNGFTFNPQNRLFNHIGELNNVDFAGTPDSGQVPTVGNDFDGDGMADLTVFRPSEATWYTLLSATGTLNVQQWGLGDDRIVPADYDGDHVTDVAVFRPSNGTWYIKQSQSSTLRSVNWGLAEDVVTPADFDGDGMTDIAVWRPSTGTWYIIQSQNGQIRTVTWGINGDRPVAGDYNGDGKADIAVWRPSNGVWYVMKIDGSYTSEHWGIEEDRVVVGDYDGDHKSDLAVFRPSTATWYVKHSSDGSTNARGHGTALDILTPGDYDGDGMTDRAVWQLSGNWNILRSTTNTPFGTTWGTTGDIPTTSAYVR